MGNVPTSKKGDSAENGKSFSETRTDKQIDERPHTHILLHLLHETAAASRASELAPNKIVSF